MTSWFSKLLGYQNAHSSPFSSLLANDGALATGEEMRIDSKIIDSSSGGKGDGGDHPKVVHIE